MRYRGCRLAESVGYQCLRCWGAGAWGVGESSINEVRIWSHSNFGEDLVFGPNSGSIYYWDATNGVTTRAVELSTLSGASDVPLLQNIILVSDISRFVFCLGVFLGRLGDFQSWEELTPHQQGTGKAQ